MDVTLNITPSTLLISTLTTFPNFRNTVTHQRWRETISQIRGREEREVDSFVYRVTHLGEIRSPKYVMP